MVSLENAYYAFKQDLKNEKETLAKFESLDITQMDEMQLEARNRGIKRVTREIKEDTEIFEEIKEELIEFIKNGGEVSEITIKELEGDL